MSVFRWIGGSEGVWEEAEAEGEAEEDVVGFVYAFGNVEMLSLLVLMLCVLWMAFSGITELLSVLLSSLALFLVLVLYWSLHKYWYRH